MTKRSNNSPGASALQIALFAGLISISTIMLAFSFKTAIVAGPLHLLDGAMGSQISISAPSQPAPTPTPTPACPATITQSVSQTISGGSVSCNDEPPGYHHTNNSYWRAFNMNTFTGGQQYNITSVSFGIEQAIAGSGSTQPATVNLYANNGVAFPGGTRTLIGSMALNVANQTGTILNVPLTATVVAGTLELVMEVFTPDGRAASNSFFIGSNAAGQTGPSYLSAADCGVPTPTNLASIGFPNMHIVMNVNGSCQGGASPTPTPTPSPTPTPTPSSTPTLGNYPDASIPLSTDTAVTPDAAPINTTRINVSTSTNFKGRLEGYPATGVVRVTNAHPAGIYIVTVRAFDSSGAGATKTFTLTVTTPPTCTPLSFTRANFGAGSLAISVVVGDFNGDGKQDLAVANRGSNVSILLGDGTGSFTAPTSIGAGTSPYSPHALAVGDFNGDGRQDLAVANINSDNVSIFLGNGAGGFSAPTNFGVGSSPGAVAVGDFNGDGRQDLAVTNYVSDNVSILLGNGAGGFSAPTNFAVGDAPSAVAVGDFNGDGRQDLAVANRNSNTVWIFLGNGAGGFSAPTDFAAGSPDSEAVGDFNGDGKQDLAVANESSSTVSILLGNGAGAFSAPTYFAANNTPESVAVGDFNGDGKQDLVVGNLGSNTVSILLGNGAGGFSAPTPFGVGSSPDSVAVGDFNGDGRQDLAVANFSSNTVSILLRDCALTPTSAVSRKVHGTAGSFDIDLPLTGSPGIECRTTGGTNDYTMIVAFPGAVIVDGDPQAEVTSGTGTVGTGGFSNGGKVTVNGNTVTIPLTNIANAQTINVTLFGVNGIGNLVIPMSVLAGDVNGNGAVNATDVALVKARIGQPVDATSYRSDVNANGTLNAGDVSIVKSRLGTGLP